MFLFVTFLLINGVYGDFFDLTDVYDPISVFWNHQRSNRCVQPTMSGDLIGECIHGTKCTLFGGKAGEPCGNTNFDRCCLFNAGSGDCSVTINGDDFSGKCMSGLMCAKTGGSALGKCGLFDKCCVYGNTCNRVSSAKVSYFEGKMKTSSESMDCSYNVILNNPYICQVRLDFEVFRLADSTFSTSPGKYSCQDDQFTVTPSNGVPVICGNNDNAHAYIHLRPTDDKIVLNVKTSKRADDTTQLAIWKIKVTQLQCAGSNDKGKDTSQFDFPLLAPSGAIQYYTDVTGYITSFGYPENYVVDQYYSIAIKRDPKYCRTSFENQGSNFYTNPIPPTADAECKDYLGIPELQKATGFVYKYCGIPKTATFYSSAPGPVNIIFKSVQTVKTTDPYRFRLKYDSVVACQ